MPTISLGMVLSAVRWIITIVGGVAATKGYVSNDVVTAIAGSSASVVGLIWSLLTHQAIALSDVANTVATVAGSVAGATKDGVTKDVASQVQTAAVDIAKGTI